VVAEHLMRRAEYVGVGMNWVKYLDVFIEFGNMPNGTTYLSKGLTEILSAMGSNQNQPLFCVQVKADIAVLCLGGHLQKRIDHSVPGDMDGLGLNTFS
jgi:hypothetical protein